MKYIDVHAHLTDKRYNLGKTYADLVGFVVVNAGYDKSSTIFAREISETYPNSYYTAGVHPEELKDGYIEFLDNLEEYAKGKNCVAIGECGLDYHYTKEKKVEQREVFIKQILIAEKLGLPLVIHSRDASFDMQNLLTEYKEHLKNGFLLHCYSDSAELAEYYVKMGAYFSFGGVVTFKNAKKEKVLEKIPIDRILSETDSPYMAPEPFRGRVNTPKYIPYIVEKLASIYGVSVEEMQVQILENAQRFYKRKF